MLKDETFTKKQLAEFSNDVSEVLFRWRLSKKDAITVLANAIDIIDKAKWGEK